MSPESARGPADARAPRAVLAQRAGRSRDSRHAREVEGAGARCAPERPHAPGRRRGVSQPPGFASCSTQPGPRGGVSPPQKKAAVTATGEERGEAPGAWYLGRELLPPAAGRAHPRATDRAPARGAPQSARARAQAQRPSRLAAAPQGGSARQRPLSAAPVHAPSCPRLSLAAQLVASRPARRGNSPLSCRRPLCPSSFKHEPREASTNLTCGGGGAQQGKVADASVRGGGALCAPHPHLHRTRAATKTGAERRSLDRGPEGRLRAHRDRRHAHCHVLQTGSSHLV